MNIVTVFTSFANKGGAEDMAISIALGLNQEGKPIIFHQDPIVCEHYRNRNVEFQKLNLKNIYRQHKHGAIFLSHHRKTTTFLQIISKLFFLNRLNVVHVAHNTFTSLKYFTLFPKNNIAVSNTVKDNMKQYFGLKDQNIEVIYNGIVDKYQSGAYIPKKSKNTIDILFLGRINPVKRQVDFVKATKGNLADNIKIYFAGLGVDYDLLEKTIGNDLHYEMLGLVDPYTELYKYDYVCLYSEKEGLPLSLIEAQMFYKPLLTNDIPQCLEINSNNFCGFVDHSWTEIIERINNLPFPDSDQYKTLSKNSRTIYEDKFKYESMIRKYTEFLSRIFQ